MNNPLKYTDPSGYWKTTPRWKQWWYLLIGKYAYINSRDGNSGWYINDSDDGGGSSGGGGGGGYSWISTPFNSPDSRSYSSTEYSRDVYSNRSGGGGGSGNRSGNVSPGDPPNGSKSRTKYSIGAAGAMYAKAYSDGLPASDGFNTDFSGLAKSIDDFYNSFNADMSGIIISGNGFVAGGGGIDFAFVSVKGDGVFILITPRGGLGGDLSVSAGWIKGNSFLTNPSGASLKGGSMSESLGALGITVGYWSDFSSKTLESGNIWEGTIGQITLGSKTVVGGNWSVGETYVIKVYSYGIN